MPNRFLLFLTLAATLHNVSCAASYKKVLLSNPDALCLDGTPGAYYVRQGPLTNKWIINFEGGGWCLSSLGIAQTLQDCLERSRVGAGSSSQYPDTWEPQHGILSDNPQNYYRNWSIVNLRYCTGTGHQGYKKDPVLYKGVNLYFRGQSVTLAQLDSLHALFGIFSSATTDIIVSGQSAGGLAAFSWTNYIRDRAAPSARVISLPDSGIFLDSANMATGRNQYRLKIQNFMKIVNEEVDTPTAECNAAYPRELWKCMFAEYIYPFIKVPLFVIQSPYDTWSQRYILGIFCENSGQLIGCNQKQLSYIEQYRTNTSRVLKAITENNAKNGYYAPSCCFHTLSFSNDLYSSEYQIPHGSQNSAIKGIVQWERQQIASYLHMDDGSWPANLTCSGLQYLEMRLKVWVFIIFVLFLCVKLFLSFLRNRKKRLNGKIEAQPKQDKLSSYEAEKYEK